MRPQSVRAESPKRFDLQGLGYLISIVSVFLLGAVAWPSESEPRWHVVAIVAGMATSVVGMALRHVAHLRQKREVARAKAKAETARN